MEANNQPTEVDLETVEREYWVNQLEALGRLEKNPDFKQVILEGYFKDRVLDGVSLLGTDYAKRENKRPEIMEQLVAISTLQDYFNTITDMGQRSIAEFEDDLEADIAE